MKKRLLIIAATLFIFALNPLAITSVFSKVLPKLEHSPGANSKQKMLYILHHSDRSVMRLAGTTQINSWTMTAENVQGTCEIGLSSDHELSEIDQLSFRLAVHDLKGDSKAMENEAYHSLKADEYQEITFNLISAKVTRQNNELYHLEALGNLTVAGVTKTITLTGFSKFVYGESISFSGSTVLHMSDFKIERPYVLFGLIRARDEMTLSYNLSFSK